MAANENPAENETAEGLDQAVANKAKEKVYIVKEECFINGVRYHEGDKVTVPAKDKVPDYWQEVK